MNQKRIALLCTAITASMVIVLALLDAAGAALAALAITMLGVLSWLVLWARAINRVLARIDRRAEEAREHAVAVAVKQEQASQRLARIHRELESVRTGALKEYGEHLHQVQRSLARHGKVLTQSQHRLKRHGELLSQAQRRHPEIMERLRVLRVALERNPGLTVDLARAYDRLVDHHHRMPELGGWALTPSTLLWILDHLESTSPETVLECGSGSSTIWIATALRRLRNDGHVIALESSEEYASLTRDLLNHLDLTAFATVLHAPLVETPLPGRDAQPWFDLSQLVLHGPVDLLFVDGPVGATAPEARYPAFPLLAKYLAADATVVLDDTTRQDEARIADLWCQEIHHGRRLREVRTIDRSTVFAVTDNG